MQAMVKITNTDTDSLSAAMHRQSAAIPTAIVVYIIAFGDFVTSEELLRSADEVRQDEKIDFNANRSNVISGIRNVAMALCLSLIHIS